MEEIDRVLSVGEREAAAAPAAPGRRVLVCDDEPITRMLVKLLLERENYVVLEATTGREGVEIARRERPDLMLIDLNMPEMDGYEAIAHVRRAVTLATMPIMVLTSEDGPGVERRVLDLGADDYIVKPFDAPVLLSRVHSVFRRLAAALAA
jgi:two-component system KDP operon response regulator KdpE